MTYDPTDTELVVFLSSAGGCSLATKPGNKDNWVERAGRGGKGGSLPNYICKIAKALMKDGKSRSQAISIAISRTKAWAAGGDDVKPDTRAKAAKAVAQWEALKAKSKAGKVVKASHTGDRSSYLFLSNVGVFDTEIVRSAWQALTTKMRQRARERKHDDGMEPIEYDAYFYIRSLWTTFIIVQNETEGTLFKIPYTVQGDDVTFGPPQAAKISYEAVDGWEDEWDGHLFEDDEEDSEIGEDEYVLLADVLSGGAA